MKHRVWFANAKKREFHLVNAKEGKEVENQVVAGKY